MERCREALPLTSKSLILSRWGKRTGTQTAKGMSIKQSINWSFGNVLRRPSSKHGSSNVNWTTSSKSQASGKTRSLTVSEPLTSPSPVLLVWRPKSEAKPLNFRSEKSELCS